MKILIAKANQDIFKEYNPNILFIESTKNTSFFIVTEGEFEKLKKWVKSKGYNAFDLMAW